MPTKLNPSPIYGPVRSRRLGLSLGVNLLPGDGKVCSFDCLYCECGLDEERRTATRPPTAAQIAPALEAKLRGLVETGERLDDISLAGNGEPTLNPEFPQIVGEVLRLRDALAPQAQVTVISNGTMAERPAVHDALMRVDCNLFKLDTVDQAYVELLDRPRGGYDVARQVEVAASFGGHVVVQTMFLTGQVGGRSVDNTGEAYVGPWLEALRHIRPQAATIYTVDRDTPVDGLAKASPQALDAIADRARALGIPCTVGY